MSKKRPNSDRETDLPDWADDVTPADEVMKKFYAPTGTFKSGPIAVSALVKNTSTSTAPDETRKGEETRPEGKGVEKAPDSRNAETREANTKQEQPEQAVIPRTPLQPIVTNTEEEPSDSLPSPALEIEIDQTNKDIVSQEPTTKNSTPDTVRVASHHAQAAPFEEFARKWRRYLYPGQLSVMRTLYELTFAHGTAECFIQYSQVASSTKMTRRNCINVMNSLVERGFVERLEVRNDATAKGIHLRVHPDPIS